jgi:hypothetical protein
MDKILAAPHLLMTKSLLVTYFLTLGSSSLSPSAIKPGINTFSMANGIIDSLVPSPAIYNSSKLQITQSKSTLNEGFRNFASSIPNGAYEMKDFSFHSVFLTSSQIRFLFLWN